MENEYNTRYLSGMSFKPKPASLHRHVRHLLQAGAIKEPPVWLPVVSSIPPQQNYIRTDPLSPAQLNRSETNNRRPHLKKTTNHSKNHLKRRPLRPHEIVYPEDNLRRRFYRDHPFELKRPRLLLEGDDGKNREDYSTLMLEGMHPTEVTGETVIRYQLYLMTVKGMKKQEAYAKATSEFYAIRAGYEETIQTAWKNAKEMGFERIRSRTEFTLQKETEELKKSAKVEKLKFSV